MRLNCKRCLLSEFVLLLIASYFPVANAGPQGTGLQMPSLYLANRPSQPASGDVLKSNDENDNEADNDQNALMKRKTDSSKNLERDKSDNESRTEEISGNTGRRKRGFDNFRTNPLNLGPLNLTNEQKDKVQAMRKESSKKARSIHTALKAKRAEMFDLMFDPQASNRQILKVRNEARKLHEQADDLMVQDFLAIRDLLTPEQKRHLGEIKPVPKEVAKSEAVKFNSVISK